MALVIAGLRECWPVVGYRILDSRYFGVAQRRRRVFFVCGPTEAGVARVLALTEGSAGDLEARGEEGAAVARAVSAGSGGSKFGSGLKQRGRGATDEVMDNLQVTEPLAFEPKASAHQSMNPSPLAPALGTTKEPAVYTHALTGEGHDAIEDGTGRGTPIVAFRRTHIRNETADADLWGDADQAGALTAEPLNGIEGHTLAAAASAVRRLTPLECERLQGFPDFWTCLCGRSEAIYEALRMVYLGVLAHGLSEREARDTVEVLQEEILRLDMRSAGPGEDRGAFQGRMEKAYSEALSSRGLQDLRLPWGTWKAQPYPRPYQRRRAGQQPGEHPDPVSVLPYESRVGAGDAGVSGHHAIPETVRAGMTDAAALACTCPDSPRYRALGNAVTVSVITWLGRRLKMVVDSASTPG